VTQRQRVPRPARDASVALWGERFAADGDGDGDGDDVDRTPESREERSVRR
jgi:hypothetical protein